MNGTCWLSRVRRQKRKAKPTRRRVRIGAPDASLTGLAGLAAVDEFTERLGMVAELDARIGPIKLRARGLTGGRCCWGLRLRSSGHDCLLGLDRVRADAGSALLSEAPVAPSTTAASLAGRFGAAQLAGIETALAGIPALAGVGAGGGPDAAGAAEPDDRSGRQRHRGVRPDQAAGRLDLRRWQGRPGASGQLGAGRAAAGRGPERGNDDVRADAGYFDAALAKTAVQLGCDFAIAAKRKPAAWRALSAVPDSDWRPARGMPGAQVAACDYAPAGWPPGTYTIIRRVKIGVDQLSEDPCSRRRRTVDKDQLALALGGAADHVWAVSFLVTNIPADDGDYVGLEAWVRNRTSIEERFREAKHGAALNYLPRLTRP